MSSTCTKSSTAISRRKYGVTAIVVLALAACGGGSGAITAPNTPKQIATDKAIAKSAVLRPSDLASDFKATPHSEDPNDKVPTAVIRKFASCTGIAEADVTSMLNDEHEPDKPSVDSPDFDKSDSTGDVSFQNNVEMDRSSKDLSDPLDHFGSASAAPCWKDFFQAAFDQSVDKTTSYSGLTIRKLPGPQIADQSAAFEATVTISAGSRSVKAALEFFFVRRGRAGVSLFASWIGVPADHALAQSLVKTVADRLDAAT